jgi:hypothetical protein
VTLTGILYEQDIRRVVSFSIPASIQENKKYLRFFISRPNFHNGKKKIVNLHCDAIWILGKIEVGNRSQRIRRRDVVTGFHLLRPRLHVSSFSPQNDQDIRISRFKMIFAQKALRFLFLPLRRTRGSETYLHCPEFFYAASTSIKSPFRQLFCHVKYAYQMTLSQITIIRTNGFCSC